MEKIELKEKIIVIGVTIGLFFPIRVFFSLYVSDNWIWSIGTMTAFAVLLVVLIKKNKLGGFGKIFEKQMRKIIGGKTGKYLIGFAVFFLVYFGATLFFMDRGDTVYAEDKEIFYLAIMEKGGYNINDLSSYELIGPQLASYKELHNFQALASIDYMFSIAYAVMNDMSDGWLEHIVMVMFVEQIELIGILFLYRNLFKSVTRVQISK
jgi:preprotein translocase subunit SecG